MADSSRLPTLVLAGGFLGSGKTTLLLAAAQLVRARGARAGIILNDQGSDLVDTQLARASGLAAAEVAGACFCCRFTDFLRAAGEVLEQNPDVIFAEPVGSCMDISATILQPLKKYYGGRFRLAPFTVLADPARAAQLLRPEADPHLAYLFRNQLAEADLVCFTKADLHAEFPQLPGVLPRRLSAHTGEGVSAWLDEVLGGRLPAGSRLLDVDYPTYAAAEASLGWLNWHGIVQLRRALPPAALAGRLLERVDSLLTEAGIAIAHLKVFNRTRTGFIKASVCRNGEPQPDFEGFLIAAPARRHDLLLNLRASGDAGALERIASRATGEIAGQVTVLNRQFFQPGEPVPEHRFHQVWK